LKHSSAHPLGQRRHILKLSAVLMFFTCVQSVNASPAHPPTRLLDAWPVILGLDSTVLSNRLKNMFDIDTNAELIAQLGDTKIEFDKIADMLSYSVSDAQLNSIVAKLPEGFGGNKAKVVNGKVVPVGNANLASSSTAPTVLSAQAPTAPVYSASFLDSAVKSIATCKSGDPESVCSKSMRENSAQIANELKAALEKARSGKGTDQQKFSSKTDAYLRALQRTGDNEIQTNEVVSSHGGGASPVTNETVSENKVVQPKEQPKEEVSAAAAPVLARKEAVTTPESTNHGSIGAIAAQEAPAPAKKPKTTLEEFHDARKGDYFEKDVGKYTLKVLKDIPIASTEDKNPKPIPMLAYNRESGELVVVLGCACSAFNEGIFLGSVTPASENKEFPEFQKIGRLSIGDINPTLDNFSELIRSYGGNHADWAMNEWMHKNFRNAELVENHSSEPKCNSNSCPRPNYSSL
jgi:hypothetical protein